jgi:transcriptional regulator with XRE-family HTH domain
MRPKKTAGTTTIPETIRANVRVYRVNRKWSQDELAERMRELGFKWTRSTVAEVEGGGRGRNVSIEEWMGLGEVFKVGAFQFILPMDESAEISLADNFSMEDGTALFVGVVDNEVIGRIAGNITDMQWKLSGRIVARAIAGPLKAIADHHRGIAEQEQLVAALATELASQVQESPELWLQSQENGEQS